MDTPNVNWMGFGLVIIGVYYLIYCVQSKDKVSFYNRSYKNHILKLAEFLKLQLYFAVIDSLFIIIFGAVLLIYNFNYKIALFSPLIFNITNEVLKLISKRKGYIKYN